MLSASERTNLVDSDLGAGTWFAFSRSPAARAVRPPISNGKKMAYPVGSREEA
jgi:hypothetical protein